MKVKAKQPIWNENCFKFSLHKEPRWKEEALVKFWFQQDGVVGEKTILSKDFPSAQQRIKMIGENKPSQASPLFCAEAEHWLYFVLIAIHKTAIKAPSSHSADLLVAKMDLFVYSLPIVSLQIDPSPRPTMRTWTQHAAYTLRAPGRDLSALSCGKGESPNNSISPPGTSWLSGIVMSCHSSPNKCDNSASSSPNKGLWFYMAIVRLVIGFSPVIILPA